MLLHRMVYLLPVVLVFDAVVAAQAPELKPVSVSPESTLRPIGSPSLVDTLRQSHPRQASQMIRRQPVVRQTAMMQATGNMAMPPGGNPAQPLVQAPALPPGSAVPPSLGGPNLQPVPLDNSPLPNPPRADLAPIPQPNLRSGMATVDNCACVSAPSGYEAGGLYACSPAYAMQTYAAPANYAAPVTYAPQVAPPTLAYAPTAGCQPLFTLGQDLSRVQVGQGIIGQPKAYVPGQSVRNFVRYFTP